MRAPHGGTYHDVVWYIPPDLSAPGVQTKRQRGRDKKTETETETEAERKQVKKETRDKIALSRTPPAMLLCTVKLLY